MHGQGYLDHAAREIREFLEGIGRIWFVPYAMHDRPTYTRRTHERLARIGLEVDSADETNAPADAARRAEAIFVGGGNTFRLLRDLYRHHLLTAIRRRIAKGVPFIGSSAGAIVAGPTIGTTKDMPIVEPPSFEALRLISFQISPHYQDPDPGSTHMGETQEERIRQFHEENLAPVVGLREGAMLRVEDGDVILKGVRGARVFRRGREPIELLPVQSLANLLGSEERRPS